MEENNDLKNKVEEWLSSEGYALEFFTASIFNRNGFSVTQGEYVRDNNSSTAREIDVTASRDIFLGEDMQLKIYHAVECKWTDSKPWVIFSSHKPMHPKACIYQTISSRLGEAVLWYISNDNNLYNNSHFITPERPGFGGRQALSKGQDLFYNAMQSVVSVSNLLMERIDSLDSVNQFSFPKYGAIVFPMLVIKGHLFNAYYNSVQDKIELSQVNHMRLHWKGSESRDSYTTVDVVVSDYLDEFLSIRAKDTESLLDSIEFALSDIKECYDKRSLASLSRKVEPGEALPDLLFMMSQMNAI